ncbi:MAG: BatA domain-containing protein [Bacteroidota bacterium]
MNFLYPGFLIALLAIAIPIVIHLFNFRRFKKVYFSNVQFLKEAKEQNSSREKLKHLLVLFSRILVITFLVLAFARPYLSDNHNAAPSVRNSVSIYVDNSYSMETVNKEGSLLDEAKRKAKELVNTYGLNDQFQLLTNDFEGKHQRLVNKDEFIQQLEEVKISSATRPLQQVINRMESTANNGSQVHYLLSDFQLNFTGQKNLVAMEPGLLNFIRLNANSLPNISIDSVWSLSPVHQPGQSEKIVVRLKNYGGDDSPLIPVKLTVNGTQKSIANLKVPSGQSVLDTLSFGGLKAGWQKCVIEIKDYPLTFDDQFNFTFNVSSELKVLNISGNPAEQYINSLFAADKYFKLTETPESNISYNTFSNYSLIILSALKNPSSGLAEQLKSYIQNGGTVIIFPDVDAGAPVYSTFLTSLSLPAVNQLNTGAPVSSTADLKNELFVAVFDNIPKNLDLPVAERYFSYVNNSLAKEPILQLPLDRFLLARYKIGSGKVYLSATSLDAKNTNLARHPVFVPLMYKVAFNSILSTPLAYVTGAEGVLEIQKIALLKNETLKLVAEQFDVIPDVRQTPGKTLLYVADQIKKAGFYDLKRGDEQIAVLAFNDNRTESDMHYADEDKLKQLFGKEEIRVINSRKDAQSLSIIAKNNSTELWKLCIILAIVFLAVETLLIRFFNIQKK